MSTPRIRTDLQATPSEEGGVKYFDIADPKSGAKMRMYDFEWLIAERMDGRRAYDEVASWARERLGIQPSTADLESYAARLKELGFFEVDLDQPSGNGKSQAAFDEAQSDDGDFETASMTAVAPLLAAETTAPKQPVLSVVKNEDAAVEAEAETEAEEPPPAPKKEAPVATAPTMAMPAVAAPKEEAQPLPAAPNAPRAPQEEISTGAVARSATPPPEKSSAGTWLALALVLLAVAALVAYLKMMSGGNAKVSTVVATPREVVRLYDTAAMVKKSDGQTLSFGESGKVSDVVAAGTEAKPGMPLATLDSFAKIEKELADVRDRDAFYEKQLAAAKAKGDDAAIKAAEAKVTEKKQLLAGLEARAAKVRLTAPSAGTVVQVLIPAGGDVQASVPVLKLADKHASADFKLGGDGAAFKVGQTVALQPANGGTQVSGRVARSDADGVNVELAEDAAVKPGDSVRLVKQRVPNVVPVPTTAVVQRNGADVVYTLADGTVHERKVTIVDRTGNEALVGSGLSGGDVVVSAGADSLKDGQKATAQ